MNIQTGSLKARSEYAADAGDDLPAAANDRGFTMRSAQRIASATVTPTFYRKRGKRLLDLTLTLLCAPIWVSVVALLAVLVALDGGNPFYSQSRIGKDGRVFRMWKLRSMVNGADDLLQSYLDSHPAARAEWDEKQKLAKDPRITTFGKLIRKTSLDELPQLWNVLRGEMSLVGPRPMMVEQKVLYNGRAYFSLLPGLTGAWQVHERNQSSFSSRSSHDDAYWANLSLGTDLRLLFLTFGVVLRGRGA